MSGALVDPSRFNSIKSLAGAYRYSQINREEQHLVAVLFHLLHAEVANGSGIGDGPGAAASNLESFLELFNCKDLLRDGIVPEVYVEYAFLRDVWHQTERLRLTLKELNEW